MKVERIDHLALTVRDIEETCKFYSEILGMEVEIVSVRKKALKFGSQKLSLHQKRKEFEPEADLHGSGPIDICFIVADSVEQIKAELENKNIQIQGIVGRSGANGKTNSIFFRDPDQNLIEVINYV